jgi:hypothetical protein
MKFSFTNLTKQKGEGKSDDKSVLFVCVENAGKKSNGRGFLSKVCSKRIYDAKCWNKTVKRY